MRANGESIYATTLSPYGEPEWGRYTAKSGVVYANVFNWPKDSTLVLTGIKERPGSAYLLADRKPLVIEETSAGFVVRLPAVAPSSISSVVVLQTAATAPK
jgi:alpha-L-fucosidase